MPPLRPKRPQQRKKIQGFHLGKRLANLGVVIRKPKDLKQHKIGNLVNARLSKIGRAERKVQDWDVIKDKKTKEIVRRDFKGTRLLPGVEATFKKARLIAQQVAAGKMTPKQVSHPRLRAFFAPNEIQEMLDYLSMGTRHTNKHALAQKLVERAQKGLISQKDIPTLTQVFGYTGSAKFTIAYNDLLTIRKQTRRLLPEAPDVITLRKKIGDVMRQREETVKELTLFRSLDKHKFANTQAFYDALHAISPQTLIDFKRRDFRDTPFIIQYAVGHNERIKNPYHPAEDILAHRTLADCKREVEETIKGGLQSLRSSNANLKHLNIDPHQEEVVDGPRDRLDDIL